MKKVLKIIGFYVLVFLVIPAIPLCIALFVMLLPPEIYETNDVADYLNIVGNNDNESPREFIQSFFPENIHDSFSDISYHYKASNADGYAYECYLEFVIEDKEVFDSFLEQYVDEESATVFLYDASYMDYTISNQFVISIVEHEGKVQHHIQIARIGKILYQPENQRLIFFALGMWDGGGTTTEELGYFFERFDIDVTDYCEDII